MRFGSIRLTLLVLLTLGPFSMPSCGQQTPGPLLSRALELIQQAKFPEAEKELLQAEEADHTSYQVEHLLGVVYERQEKYPLAEEALERAVKLGNSREPDTLLLLCKVKFTLKKTDEALALAKRISVLSQNDPRMLYSLGRLLRESVHGEQAIAELEKARSLAPRNPAIATELVAACLDQHRDSEARTTLDSLLKTADYDDLIQAGSRFGEANRLDTAVEAFERAVALRPSEYDGLFDLAFAYYRLGNSSKSLDVLRRLEHARASDSADYHYLRAKVDAALHHDSDAATEFREALGLQPDNESLCVDAGLFFSRFQDFWKALEILQACSQLVSDSAAVETGLGLTYFRLGKYPDAVQSFQKVLALNPQADAAREALGFLLYISGKLPEARQVLEERLSAPQADFYIYFLHALVLLRLDKMGNAPAAKHSLNEALARNPSFAPAYFQRGKIAFETGDLARGLADLETATRLDPTYAPPYYLIAQIYFKQGNPAAAQQAQSRFNSLNREQEEKEQAQQVENRLVQALQ
ncbi:MAG TPA: tetratricopeptide repeat protein [Terriglobia bacterium]|nr:tetratricopeptide repeat protein [Terriglobia bacterium]